MIRSVVLPGIFLTLLKKAMIIFIDRIKAFCRRQYERRDPESF